VVTGFLIVIFYRNQLQRSSSTETLCAREVHRMVLGGLNVQILHQKMLVTSLHVLVKRRQLYDCCQVWRISLRHGQFRTKALPVHIRRRSRVSYSGTWHVTGKFGIYTKKTFSPKLQKSEEILEIRRKLKLLFSEFRKNRFDNFTKSI